MKAYYESILPGMREEARAHGYALAVHGSMTHDLDLIALAWSARASSPAVVADAVAGAIGVKFAHLVDQTNPHRFVFHIITSRYRQLEDGEKVAEGFIDLSVAKTGIYSADRRSAGKDI